MWQSGQMVRSLLTHTLLLAVSVFVLAVPLKALEPIVIGDDQDKIEITLLGELYAGRGDKLQVDTASGADGIAGRMSVDAKTSGTSPNWVVFALNNSFRQANRALADGRPLQHYRFRRHLARPGCGSHRTGDALIRISSSSASENDGADIFRIELEPGATVTFIAELRSQRFPRLYLWKARAFENDLRNSTLFKGIMLGITGLLAVFLTAIFVANHKAIFPMTAIIAWSVVAYLCVDFGFWHKLFRLSPEDNAIYRGRHRSSDRHVDRDFSLYIFTIIPMACMD